MLPLMAKLGAILKSMCGHLGVSALTGKTAKGRTILSQKHITHSAIIDLVLKTFRYQPVTAMNLK